MKRVLFVALVLSFIGNICVAQKSTYTENRQVNNFDKLYSCCGIDVYISEGSSNMIRIETTHQEFLQYLTTDVINGELKISVKNNQHNKFKNLKTQVFISASNLSSIKATSGANIYNSGSLNARDIYISATSGATIRLDLKADNIQCKATSGSEIVLKGSARYAKMAANSAGNINMYEFQLKEADARASSGSDIKLRVSDKLDARASSGGSIKYKGEPKDVNRSSGSGGSVKRS